jgi:hypothetical protein
VENLIKVFSLLPQKPERVKYFFGRLSHDITQKRENERVEALDKGSFSLILCSLVALKQKQSEEKLFGDWSN